MRLLDDCRTGRVTLVYTKSISRFARNTVDVLAIVRELKKMNVPVYFENEQLYSFDKEAELAISHISNKTGQLMTCAHDLRFACSADTAIDANLIS